jgi:hypothetical protein
LHYHVFTTKRKFLHGFSNFKERDIITYVRKVFNIYTLDETGIQERKKGRLQRRVYNVKGPNHLWHIDTNHKLIREHFVIVGGIDGYSRLVM